jgi:CHRD domain-containing protein
MKKLRITALMAAMAVMAMLSTPALSMAQETFHANLVGFSEVPPISTEANGTFQATVSADDTSIAYELTYDGLEAAVTQSHIHFGQFFVSGGISVFLCQTAGSPDPSGLAPTCPQSGTVMGTITAANVVGPGVQGIAAGEFAELLTAIRRGLSYANVHSAKIPSGEIRGQLMKKRFE